MRVLLVAVLAAAGMAGTAQAFELSCGACRDNCARQHIKLWNKGKEVEFSKQWWTCQRRDCGCCNELIQRPERMVPNYSPAWNFEYYNKTDGWTRALPSTWGTSGTTPLDIREGDQYVDGRLAVRVSSEPVPRRPYYYEVRPSRCSKEFDTECMWKSCTAFREDLEACARSGSHFECVLEAERGYTDRLRACRAAGQDLGPYDKAFGPYRHWPEEERPGTGR